MTYKEKIIDTITDKRRNKFKQFMALVALGMMIGQTSV